MLLGGKDDDVLKGGAGQDTLTGGTGDDRLQGGTGADMFVFNPSDETDHIKDWEIGTDRLDLSEWKFDSFADITSTMSQTTGGALRLQLDTNKRIVIENLTSAELLPEGIILLY